MYKNTKLIKYIYIYISIIYRERKLIKGEKIKTILQTLRMYKNIFYSYLFEKKWGLIQ